MHRLRIVLAGSLASYPEGGGHWALYLQYLLGLTARGCDVFWLDLLESAGDATQDTRLIATFAKRLDEWGFKDRWAIVVCENENEQSLAPDRLYGMSESRFKEVAQSADSLWNFCGCIRQPLLSLFKHRVLMDGDPGLFQICALEGGMGIEDHQVFLTVGTNLHSSDCEVPTLGVRWHSFPPAVYLPMWDVAPDPGEQAPFTSVTEWTWHQIAINDRLLSASKREAYLRFVELPRHLHQSFELAANIDPQDDTGDRELLRSHGWKLVHPHHVAATPAAYRDYIRSSRAEIACCKPIYRELKTGWFSDRSACYLASGRPVLAEATGFGRSYPTGQGLLVFSTFNEAVAGVEEIAGNYERHCRAAREIAEAYFDSNKVLSRLLAEIDL